MSDAATWIARLGLTPHPEGGWYVETYRSPDRLPPDALPEGYSGDRPCSSAIYFLVTPEAPSRFHRLRADEVWHFYDGTGLTLHCLHPDGRYGALRLGRRPEGEETCQAVVRGGVWMAAEVEETNGFALAGCTVAPGFEFDDFELAVQANLVEKYPEQRLLIARLTGRDT